MSRSADVAQRVAAGIAELRRIRLLSDADAVEDDGYEEGGGQGGMRLKELVAGIPLKIRNSNSEILNKFE